MHSRPIGVMPHSPLSPNNFWPLQQRTSMQQGFLRPRRPLLEQYVRLISGEYWVSDPHQHSDLHHHDHFKWPTVENDILYYVYFIICTVTIMIVKIVMIIIIITDIITITTFGWPTLFWLKTKTDFNTIYMSVPNAPNRCQYNPNVFRL